MRFFNSKSLDKRKLKRLQAGLNLKFRIISGGTPPKKSSEIKAISKDISPYGLSMETGTVQIEGFHISHDSSMMKKNRLDIELTLPSEKGSKDPEIVRINGEVAWYDKKTFEHGYPYLVGVQFINLSSENREKIEALISNQ